MLKRIVLLALIVTLGAALASPLFAAQAIAGAVANVQSGDNANLGGSVGCRIYSLHGPGINRNTAGTCLDARCPPPLGYEVLASLSPGGYACNQENTGPYGVPADTDNQTFYNLVDAEAHAGACNHVAFYAVQGLVARNAITTGVTGAARQDNCGGSASQNCFQRADSPDARSTPLLNTNSGYGPNAHQITGVGGFSPVPVVRVAYPSNCSAGFARLTWDEPHTYAANMKNGVASPVKGVRLWSNGNGCSFCPDGSNGWVAGSAFPMGAGATGVCVQVTGPKWYALTVRLTGPDALANPSSEVETGRVGAGVFVGANSQCVSPSGTAVRIANLAARYVGRGSVNVSFTTGLEGGVQSYFVTRGTSPAGPFERVSEAIIPQGDASSYSITDRVRTALGRKVYYSIEVVNADGSSERSGTQGVTLPAAKRKLAH